VFGTYGGGTAPGLHGIPYSPSLGHLTFLCYRVWLFNVNLTVFLSS